MNIALEKENLKLMKHHRVVVTRHGEPDVLQVVEEDCPEPQAGEVRVKVMAAGISAYDLMFRRSGWLPGTPKPPFTLGEDIVGVVFDPIGGARQLWRSYRALGGNGRLVWFGVAATKKTGLRVIPSTLLTVGLLKLIPDGKQVPMTPDLGKENAWYLAKLAELLGLLATGQIKPVVAARIPLIEAARAHGLIERGGYAGKVVLVAR